MKKDIFLVGEEKARQEESKGDILIDYSKEQSIRTPGKLGV